MTTADGTQGMRRGVTPRERFYRQHEVSVQQRLDKGVMPKDLVGLMRWFEGTARMESPAKLHVDTVWVDRVNEYERERGIQPVGASYSGAPAYADDFRRVLENGPSELDRRDPSVEVSGQTYFRRPLAAAIARMARNGRPLTARILLSIVRSRFQWREVADQMKLDHEIFEMYLREALVLLWRDYKDWVPTHQRSA